MSTCQAKPTTGSLIAQNEIMIIAVSASASASAGWWHVAISTSAGDRRRPWCVVTLMSTTGVTWSTFGYTAVLQYCNILQYTASNTIYHAGVVDKIKIDMFVLNYSDSV